ncbi:MAG TPA: MarR family winged helix-turn-helix transcriptional regulator [Caulobacteraceae bacterium]|jgi:DNA-binding MarR family transcriptional regulator|nr:MarR family winged helix-turn-helix transcriptional regulator [Caulobacteraceae bacterium]
MTAHGATTARVRVPVKTIDRDRYFPQFISSIANKISRGGSRVYLQLFGIGIIEWRILSVLAHNPKSTANVICNTIDLDKAAASRSIQVLEQLGYVATATDPGDGRKRSVSLTPAGQALHDRAIKVALQREQQLLVGFDDHEREVLLGLLRRMHANAVEMDSFDYATLDPAPAISQPARARRKHDAHAA